MDIDLVTALVSGGAAAAAFAAVWRIAGFIADVLKSKMAANHAKQIENRNDRTSTFEQATRIIERYNKEIAELKNALAAQSVHFEAKLVEQKAYLYGEIALLIRESVQLSSQNAQLVAEIIDLRDQLKSALVQIEELKKLVLKYEERLHGEES